MTAGAYSYGRPRIPRAEAKLPEGGPLHRGLPLDDGIPGTSTFVKPLDDNDTAEQNHPDESIHRIDNPRNMRKERDRIDVVDQSHSTPGFFGLGKPHESPKTQYPYRDGKPNTHNASAEFVAGLWLLESAPERLLVAGTAPSAFEVSAASWGTMSQGLNPAIQQKAAQCRADLKRADMKNLRWVFSVNCGNGGKAVRFKASRKGNITKFQKMDFHVSCSCPAWRWQGPEFHSTTNNYQDPTTGLQGTASPPDIRDPDRVNKVCKHVAAVLSFTSEWSIPKSKSRPKKKRK